jgi:hypothetical protein
VSKTRDGLLDDLAMLGFALEVPFRGLDGTRKWRWDAAKGAVAVEYHGKGAHTSYIAGTWRDQEKVTEGQLCGFTVIQCNVASVNDGRCWTWIMKALGEA